MKFLFSSTNAVSFNLISEGHIKYCGIHSQHDLRSTTWTRNFCCCYFGLGVGKSLLLMHWIRNKYHHKSQKLISSSKILEYQKIDLLLVSTRGLALTKIKHPNVKGKGTHKIKHPNGITFSPRPDLYPRSCWANVRIFLDISGDAAVACCFVVEMKFDLYIDVLHNKSAYEKFVMFFTYLAHQTTCENLLKTRFILEMKFDLEIEIFKVKGVCGNFFTFFSNSAREIT